MFLSDRMDTGCGTHTTSSSPTSTILSENLNIFQNKETFLRKVGACFKHTWLMFKHIWLIGCRSWEDCIRKCTSFVVLSCMNCEVFLMYNAWLPELEELWNLCDDKLRMQVWGMGELRE